MNEEKLKEFYNDKGMQIAVLDFVYQTINEEALRRVYNGGDTSKISEAKELIELSFKNLKDKFTPEVKRKVAPKGV